MNGAPGFSQQRVIAFALLLGMTMFAVVVAIVLQTNGGKGLAAEPLAALDTAVIACACSLGVLAFVVRARLAGTAARAEPQRRAGLRFKALLVPLAMLEGACLFALTVWMLNGTAVPSLVVAMVMLAMAIWIVPFQDPDAAGS